MISGNGFAYGLETSDRQSYPNIHLAFIIMSAKLIALAAELVDTNPAGAQLIVNITKAETGAELAEALDNYDSVVLENATEPVGFDYVESPMIEQVLGIESVAV